jgi:hypothetical protein
MKKLSILIELSTLILAHFKSMFTGFEEAHNESTTEEIT